MVEAPAELEHEDGRIVNNIARDINVFVNNTVLVVLVQYSRNNLYVLAKKIIYFKYYHTSTVFIY